MNLDDIRILTFDCYGTLIDWETGMLTAVHPWLKRVGASVSDDDVLQAFALAESRAQRSHPQAPYPEILSMVADAMADTLGIEISDDERAAFAASVGDWPAFPDAHAALVELGVRFRLGILSNVDRTSFAGSEQRLGVEFDVVMTAQDIGSYKPDLANFRFMIDELARRGIARHQILHVAQSLYHDIAPARRVGLATVWIDRRRGRPGFGATPPSNATADVAFGGLAQLARWVADLHG